MKSKKTAPKKTVSKSTKPQNGVTAFTWFLFSVFLVVSFLCINYIKQSENQAEVIDNTAPVVVNQPKRTPSETPVKKVSPQQVKVRK